MLTLNATRLDNYVQMVQDKVDAKLASGELTEAQIQDLSNSLDMDFTEFAAFQELKSLAMMHGKLSQDEAQQVYMWLGETPCTFNNQRYAIKHTLTVIFSELLKWRQGL